ncbi:MAG: hypothetical protein Q4B48_08820 [Syntrophomonadaceae bacterium]|nr:hypothetical protein [Syntrophomonadaceae bacterium]
MRFGKQRARPSGFMALTAIFALLELALLAGWCFGSGDAAMVYSKYFVWLPLCYSLPAVFSLELCDRRSNDATNKEEI